MISKLTIGARPDRNAVTRVITMDRSFSPDDDAFRKEVRAFIREHYPPELRVANSYTDLTKQQMLLWHRILHKKGWIAPRRLRSSKRTWNG